MEKRNKNIIIVLIFLLIALTQPIILWQTAINKIPIMKDLKCQDIEQITLQHRYNPIVIHLSEGDPLLPELTKLLKYWWFSERFNPIKLLTNHVAEYKAIIIIKENSSPIELYVCPNSKIYDYLKNIGNSESLYGN